MRKFIKYICAVLLLSLLLFEGVLAGIIVQKKGVFHSSYQSLLVDKYRRLQKTNEPKIIIISGSSCAFGLDQDMLEKETGYKVVNFGLYAGFGHRAYSELAKENINPGDIVLFAYEYDWIAGFETYGQDLLMSGIDENIDLYKHIGVRYWPEFIGYATKYAEKKNTFKEATDDYSRRSFDSATTQMTLPRARALSDYKEKKDDYYGIITVRNDKGKVKISRNSKEYLRDYKELIEKKGATAYFAAPPMLDESLDCEVKDLYTIIENEEEKIGIPFISDPELYMFPGELMYDTVYHCNSEGEKLRTGILIDDLKRCGVVKQDEYTGGTRSMKGETMALKGTIPKLLLRSPVSVSRVYMTGEGGETVTLEEGRDYELDMEHGSIRRTEDSRIPDYDDHKVEYTEDHVFRQDGDGKVNPEGNDEYQIKVDYEYNVTEEEESPLSEGECLLSSGLQKKLKNGEAIDITLCGDSIGAGLYTDGEGTFINYLRDGLAEYYGASVSVNNASVPGMTAAVLKDQLGSIISAHPDVAVIELGMNDHLGADAAEEEKVSQYISDIETIVKTLKENDIDVVLTGFFQQNVCWERENIPATKKYNEILRETAAENEVAFADVYELFQAVSSRKHICSDVLSDDINHPNEWGHRLYFSSLIGAFDTDGTMKPSDFKNYIFTE